MGRRLAAAIALPDSVVLRQTGFTASESSARTHSLVGLGEEEL